MRSPSNPSDDILPASNVKKATTTSNSDDSLKFGNTAKLATAAIVVISAGLLIPLYFARPKGTPEGAKTAIQSLKATNSSPVSLLKRSTVAPSKAALPQPSPAMSQAQIEAAKEAVGLGFNPGLYTIGAFGIATMVVSSGALAGVFTLQQATGATTLSEFSAFMKRFVHERLPKLEEKLYRPADEFQSPDGVVSTSSWSWTDAERRLSDAYDKGGFGSWASQAFEELESERKAVKSDMSDLHVAGESPENSK